MKTKVFLLISLTMLIMSLSTKADNKQLERGEGMFTFQDPENKDLKPVDVHYYIPEDGNITTCPIIFVFQGNDRDYTYLMDTWGKDAKDKHYMVFIPQFNMKDYPLHLYQEVGVMDKKHTVLTPKNKTTASMVDRIFEYIKGHTSTLRNDFQIYGHSAGGQFVQRFMLFHDSPYVSRAVIGSPGWYTFPDKSTNFPYGIKDIPYIDSTTLKCYLNKDIVIQTATLDTVREWFLRKTPEADAQGRNRLERGKRFYSYCQKYAAQHNWPFRWRMQTVVNVNHDAILMGKAASDILTQPTDEFFMTPTLKNIRENGKISTYQEIEDYLINLTNKHPKQATLHTFGKTLEGRNVIGLHIGSTKENAIKIWIQGGLHGNEPAPVESVCMLAQYLLETEEGIRLANNLNILCLAVANPDGYNKQERNSGNGLDLNRDMTKMNDPMTHLLKRAWIQFRPDVSFDIHEYNPRRKEIKKFYGKPLETKYDVLLMTSGHPNISPCIKDLQQQLFDISMKRTLEKNGYSYAPYFTPFVENEKMNARIEAKSPQSSATWNALAGSISLFAEIKGIGFGEKLFAKRAMIGFILACDVLKSASNRRNWIMKSTRNKESSNSKNDSVVVTFQPNTKEVYCDFVNWENGEIVTHKMTGHNALQPVALIKRDTPKGYLLKTSQCLPIINRLKLLGIKMESLNRTESVKVEEYKVTKVDRQDRLWEKIHPSHVETKIIKKKIKPSKGWIYISIQQPLKNLITTLLEPESVNGFVAFDVISVSKNKSLPWVRVCE